MVFVKLTNSYSDDKKQIFNYDKNDILRSYEVQIFYKATQKFIESHKEVYNYNSTGEVIDYDVLYNWDPSINRYLDHYYYQNKCINSALSERMLEKGHLEVYPNPVNSNVKIITEWVEDFSLINGLGQICLVGTLNKGDNQLNLSHLAPGVYFLRTNRLNYKLQVIH